MPRDESELLADALRLAADKKAPAGERDNADRLIKRLRAKGVRTPDEIAFAAKVEDAAREEATVEQPQPLVRDFALRMHGKKTTAAFTFAGVRIHLSAPFKLPF